MKKVSGVEFRILFSLFLFFIGSSLFAENIHLSTGLEITQEQLQKISQSLRRTSSTVEYYHWADTDRAVRWVQQGFVDQGEIDLLTKPSGVRQNYGGGVYLSSSSTNSSHLNSTPIQTVFEIPEGTLIYDDKVVTSVIGSSLTGQEASELGQHIPFIRKVNSEKGWYVINHPLLAKTVYLGSIDYERVPQMNQTPLELRRAIAELQKVNPKFGYLESLFHLMAYQDGVSFLRSVRVNPSNPWAEFEPQNFEAYRATRNWVFDQLEKTDRTGTRAGLGITSRSFAGETIFGGPLDSRELWVEAQVQTLLRIARGVANNTNLGFRTGDVRAGGDQGNAEFLANLSQVEALKANPFLTVAVRPSTNPGEYFVSYQYPSVLTWERFAERLSSKVREELEALDLHKVDSRDPKVMALNQEIVLDLVKSVFRDHYQRPLSPRLLVDLMAVHPLQDFNGRSLRLYNEAAYLEGRKLAPYFLVGDFDLMSSPAFLESLAAEGGQALGRTQNLMFHLIREAAKKGSNIEMLPNLPYESLLLEPFRTYGMAARPTVTQLEWIRTRNWEALFNELLGRHWSLSEPSTLEASLRAIAADYHTHQKLVEPAMKKLEELLRNGRSVKPALDSHWAVYQNIDDFKKFLITDIYRSGGTELKHCIEQVILGTGRGNGGHNMLPELVGEWLRSGTPLTPVQWGMIELCLASRTFDDDVWERLIKLEWNPQDRANLASYVMSKVKDEPYSPIFRRLKQLVRSIPRNEKNRNILRETLERVTLEGIRMELRGLLLLSQENTPRELEEHRAALTNYLGSLDRRKGEGLSHVYVEPLELIMSADQPFQPIADILVRDPDPNVRVHGLIQKIKFGSGSAQTYWNLRRSIEAFLVNGPIDSTWEDPQRRVLLDYLQSRGDVPEEILVRWMKSWRRALSTAGAVLASDRKDMSESTLTRAQYILRPETAASPRGPICRILSMLGMAKSAPSGSH